MQRHFLSGYAPTIALLPYALNEEQLIIQYIYHTVVSWDDLAVLHAYRMQSIVIYNI